MVKTTANIDSNGNLSRHQYPDQSSMEPAGSAAGDRELAREACNISDPDKFAEYPLTARLRFLAHMGSQNYGCSNLLEESANHMDRMQKALEEALVCLEEAWRGAGKRRNEAIKLVKIALGQEE